MKKTETFKPNPLNFCFFFMYEMYPNEDVEKIRCSFRRKKTKWKGESNEKEREYDKVPTYSYCS